MSIVMMAFVTFLALSPSFSHAQIFFYFEPGPGKPPVQGESLMKDHVNDTEILSLSSGFSNAITISSATSGMGAGKASFSEIKYKKMLGKSSASLLNALCTGSNMGKVEIRYYTPPVALKINKYLVLSLENVFISAIEHEGTGTERPTESISLNYGKITWNYFEPDALGIYKLVSTTSWNRVTNTLQ